MYVLISMQVRFKTLFNKGRVWMKGRGGRKVEVLFPGAMLVRGGGGELG